MEKTIMKITNLEIKKLHGYVDYDVSFNDNITFLYGDNGCGKTTILNIITYMITGKIYELFRYKFEKIKIEYSSSATRLKEDLIVYLNEDNQIKIEYSQETATIDSQRFEIMNKSPEDIEEIERFYFSEYPILKRIKDVFNYIYLPLNRNSNIQNSSFSYRNRRIIQTRYVGRSRKSIGADMTLIDVEALVANAYNKANYISNRISEDFSDEILKSFLDVENTSNISLIVDYMNKLNSQQIRKMQKDYTNIIKTILNMDDEAERKIALFFDSLIKDIAVAQKNLEDLSLELLFKLSELTKINNIISKAEKAEQEKKKAKQPLEDFLNTVNSFIQGNNGSKQIDIDAEGIVYLESHGKNIDIHNLSSGEKQIITFFAYLIFGLESTNQSIFIVDEPELSLHLNWQRKFVDSIMSINKNVQLIFATHAPEMIGKHRNKAVKLIPVNNEKENQNVD